MADKTVPEASDAVMVAHSLAAVLRELLEFNKCERLDPLAKTALRDATIAALNKAKALSDEL
jgi:hypothetical protein